MSEDSAAGPVTRVGGRAAAPIGATPPAVRHAAAADQTDPEVTAGLHRRLGAVARIRATVVRLTAMSASARATHATLELADVVEVLDLVDQLMRSLAYDRLVDPCAVLIAGVDRTYRGPRGGES